MITKMKKNYENPMLQVVSIKKSDIVTTSPEVEITSTDFNPNTFTISAPGRRDVDSWYEGY